MKEAVAKAVATQCSFSCAHAKIMQGLSLDKARIDLRKAFTDGMAYVALSRCRSTVGLQLDGFCSKGITASFDVLEYYENLERQANNLEACRDPGAPDGDRTSMRAEEDFMSLSRAMRDVGRTCVRWEHELNSHRLG